MKYYNNKLFYLVLICFFTGKSVLSQEGLKGVAYSGNEFDVDWEKKNYKLEYKNIVYKTVDELGLKLDILGSKSLSKDAPVVIYVHGGDWNKGNKTYVHRPLVEDVFQRIINMGYRVISIDYRLCRPHTPVTMAISDAKDAVRWVKQNGKQYGIDAKKIILMGTSAGGHISMMAAYSSDDKYKGDTLLSQYSSEVSGVINCYGPVDVLRPFRYRSGITIQLGRWLFNKTLYRTFVNTSYDFSGFKYPIQKKELRAFLKEQSVTTIKNPRNTPTLTLQGLADFTVQPSNARILHKYLDRYDIPNTMRLFKNVNHSFALATPFQMEQMCNATENFINSVTESNASLYIDVL